jgi:hypothetical protein
MTVLTIRTNLTYNSYKSVDRNIIPNVGTSCFTTGIDSIQCWSSIHLASCP